MSQFLFSLRLPDLLPLVDFFFFLVLSLGVSDPLSLLCNLRDESEVVLPILPLGVFGGAKISSSEWILIAFFTLLKSKKNEKMGKTFQRKNRAFHFRNLNFGMESLLKTFLDLNNRGPQFDVNKYDLKFINLKDPTLIFPNYLFWKPILTCQALQWNNLESVIMVETNATNLCFKVIFQTVLLK